MCANPANPVDLGERRKQLGKRLALGKISPVGDRVLADQVQLDDASRRFCPDVAPKSDVDIRTSLAEADVLTEPAAAFSS